MYISCIYSAMSNSHNFAILMCKTDTSMPHQHGLIRTSKKTSFTPILGFYPSIRSTWTIHQYIQCICNTVIRCTTQFINILFIQLIKCSFQNKWCNISSSYNSNCWFKCTKRCTGLYQYHVWWLNLNWKHFLSTTYFSMLF